MSHPDPTREYEPRLDHHSEEYDPEGYRDAVLTTEPDTRDYEPVVLKEYKGGDIPPKLIWVEGDMSPYYLAWTGEEVDGQRQAVLVKWIPY